MPAGGPTACPKPIERARTELVERAHVLRALVRWQHAAGPFWPYVSAAPFLSGPAATEATGVSGDTIPDVTPGVGLFLDLPPTETLRLSPAFSQAGLFVVPIFQRWCPEPSVIPSGELLDLLISHSRLLRRPREPSGAVFLLDGSRRGPRRPRLSWFDNRYGYSQNAFPPAAVLIRHGITEVRFVSPAEPARDLWGYVAALQRDSLPCAFSSTIPTS